MGGCGRCGAENPIGAKFCMGCGAQLDAGAPEMIKLVTILFADVVGSTSMGERMHPDEVRALMVDFFETMSEEILAEGGTIERLVGDALMVDFGVPVGHEDDAERAVRAARRMLARLDHWNASRPPQHRVQIRIGINTGEVSTGGSFGEHLMVMGDAVNVAARLQEAAEPGTVLVGERTARAVRRAFRLRPAQQVIAKGKSQPVQAFVVDEEVDRADHAGFLHAPIVGRDAELETLREIFDRTVREGSPQVVTIVGDPGVGKSRLVQDLTASLEPDAHILKGRCLPYGDGVTLAPLHEILRAETGIVPQDDPQESLAKIETLVRDLLGDLPADENEGMAAALAATMGLAPALETLAELDPRFVYREMVRAWRALLGARATNRPVVAVIEDVYWADDTMLDVLTDLSLHIEGPVLFLCTARPDFVVARSAWFAGLRSHSSLRIEPLGPHHSGSLAAALLGAGALPPDLADQVVMRAEGNPLFIEEILLRLIDGGHLVERNGSWIVTGDLSEIDVPERIQTLIQARLDLLPPAERNLLQAAAVVGRYFWSGAVERITGSAEVQEIADSLKRRQMIVEQLTSSIPGEIEYAFRHVLIRDVAYETLPRKIRAGSHAAVANWIEALRGARVGEVSELLADHYERAYDVLEHEHLRTSARRYQLLAAQSALRRFAIGQAERFGRRAVELSLPGPERVEALETLGDAFYQALRGTPAWEAYTAAIAELEDSPDATTLARLTAKAAIVPTRWMGTMEAEVPPEEVGRLIDSGLDAVGERDSRERALLLSARAFLAGTADRPTEVAERAAREAVEMAERLHDPNLISAAMDGLAMLLWPTGRLGEITRIDRARLKVVDDLSDVREIADVLLSAGRDITRVGNYDEALGYLDRAVNTVREIDPGQYLHAIVHRAATLFALGRWDDALADLAQIERLENVSDDDAPTYAIRAIGIGYVCSHLRGELDPAERYLRILRRYSRDKIDRLGSPDALDPLALPARALARAGNVAEAMTWLSLERWQSVSEHLEAACDIIAVAGRWDQAPEALAQSRKEVEYGELLALECYADRLEGHMLRARGENNEALRLLLRSAEGFSSLSARWEEAWSRLGAAQLLAEDGANKAARAEIQRALPVFDDLRSVEEGRVCRELVSSL